VTTVPLTRTRSAVGSDAEIRDVPANREAQAIPDILRNSLRFMGVRVPLYTGQLCFREAQMHVGEQVMFRYRV